MPRSLPALSYDMICPMTGWYCPRRLWSKARQRQIAAQRHRHAHAEGSRIPDESRMSCTRGPLPWPVVRSPGMPRDRIPASLSEQMRSMCPDLLIELYPSDHISYRALPASRAPAPPVHSIPHPKILTHAGNTEMAAFCRMRCRMDVLEVQCTLSMGSKLSFGRVMPQGQAMQYDMPYCTARSIAGCGPCLSAHAHTYTFLQTLCVR